MLSQIREFDNTKIKLPSCPEGLQELFRVEKRSGFLRLLESLLRPTIRKNTGANAMSPPHRTPRNTGICTVVPSDEATG
jgi:hypothetical protein